MADAAEAHRADLSHLLVQRVPATNSNLTRKDKDVAEARAEAHAARKEGDEASQRWALGEGGGGGFISAERAQLVEEGVALRRAVERAEADVLRGRGGGRIQILTPQRPKLRSASAHRSPLRGGTLRA
jgi:hypothetical protein